MRDAAKAMAQEFFEDIGRYPGVGEYARSLGFGEFDVGCEASKATDIILTIEEFKQLIAEAYRMGGHCCG